MKKLSWLLSLIVLAFACQEDHVEKKNSRVLIDAMTSSVSVDCTQGAITDVILGEALAGTVSVSDASTDLDFELDFTGGEYFLLSDSVWAGDCQALALVHDNTHDLDDEIRSHSIPIPLASLPECGCVRVKLEIARINPINTTIETYIWEQKVEYCKCPEERNTWKIAIYTLQDGDSVLTNGYAQLARPDGSSIGYSVNGMTTIEYDGDPNFAWTLIAGKDGYQSESVPFVFSEIPGDGEKAFKFLLEPLFEEGAFAFSPQGEGPFEFEVGFMGSGSLLIEWGDGFSQLETFTNVDPSAITTRHISVDITEAVPIVNVTGDLDRIVSYRNFSVYSTFLDVSGLTKLRDLFIEGAVLDELDLSANVELASLQLNVTTVIYGTTMSSHPSLDYIKVNLFGSGIESLIQNIGQNATSENIHGGTFSYDEESVFYHPLTPESVATLQNLEDNYGWTIIYQPI